MKTLLIGTVVVVVVVAGLFAGGVIDLDPQESVVEQAGEAIESTVDQASEAVEEAEEVIEETTEGTN